MISLRSEPCRNNSLLQKFTQTIAANHFHLSRKHQCLQSYMCLSESGKALFANRQKRLRSWLKWYVTLWDVSATSKPDAWFVLLDVDRPRQRGPEVNRLIGQLADVHTGIPLAEDCILCFFMGQVIRLVLVCWVLRWTSRTVSSKPLWSWFSRSFAASSAWWNISDRFASGRKSPCLIASRITSISRSPALVLSLP